MRYGRGRHVRPSGKRLINPMGGREFTRRWPKKFEIGCAILEVSSRNLGQTVLAVSLVENSQRHRGPIDSGAGSSQNCYSTRALLLLGLSDFVFGEQILSPSVDKFINLSV